MEKVYTCRISEWRATPEESKEEKNVILYTLLLLDPHINVEKKGERESHPFCCASRSVFPFGS